MHCKMVAFQNLCEYGMARCIAEREFDEGLELESYGICDDSSCKNDCSEAYSPQCGSDGNNLEVEKRLSKNGMFQEQLTSILAT